MGWVLQFSASAPVLLTRGRRMPWGGSAGGAAGRSRTRSVDPGRIRRLARARLLRLPVLREARELRAEVRAEVRDCLSGEHLLLGDHPLRAAPTDESDDPVQQRRDAVLEADDVDEVDGQPEDPGEEPAELRLAHRRHGREPRDRRHRALVADLAGPSGPSPLQTADDLLRGVAPTLDGDLRDARQSLQGHHVADDVDLGVAGQGEVVLDLDATGPVERSARLFGELATERRGADACGPHLADGLDALTPTVTELHLDAGRVDVDDLGAEAHLDAHVGQSLDGPVAELLPERAEHSRRGVEQDDARLGGVDASEVALEGAPGQLGDLAGHRDAGRARADD